MMGSFKKTVFPRPETEYQRPDTGFYRFRGSGSTVL
jgi:hypothetical protein